MPSKYPILSSSQVISILEAAGFVIISQKGSHKKLKKGTHTVIVPMHPEIAKGTLKSIINQSGLMLSDFII